MKRPIDDKSLIRKEEIKIKAPIKKIINNNNSYRRKFNYLKNHKN